MKRLQIYLCEESKNSSLDMLQRRFYVPPELLFDFSYSALSRIYASLSLSEVLIGDKYIWFSDCGGLEGV